jgi:hypothetical protein
MEAAAIYAAMLTENIMKLAKAAVSEEVSTTMEFLSYTIVEKILTINRLTVFGFDYSENLGFRQRWR